MGKKSSNSTKQQFADYYMSIHFGAVIGPVDACTGIYIGEKIAWEGFQDTEAAIIINQPFLWGGQLKEGGAIGQAYFLPGNETQVAPEFYATRLSRTSATCPAFRGFASLIFTAVGGAFTSGFAGSFSGFKWGTNSPYIRPVWARFFRKPVGIRPELALIEVQVERKRTITSTVNNVEQETEVTDIFNVQDANPSHIIYECLTNTTWGMGASNSQINIDSFEYAAEVLFDEKFGLSLMWTQQAPIESFVTEILEHIQATLFVDPRTGLLTLLLIRDNYDVNDLRIFDPDNSFLENFQTKAWGETINEIIVTWTNPANEQEQTVIQHDLANIAMQGGIVSDSRNYYGVRNEALALDLAARDLRSAATPLRSCNIEVDRSAWDLLPGEVVKITWPEYGVDQLVMRVGNVDYGRIGDPKIKAALVEDIFALPYAVFHTSQQSQWQDPSQVPAPITTTQPFTVPYYLVKQADASADLEYPNVVAGVFASQVGSDTIGFELYEEQLTSTGTLAYQPVGSMLMTGRAALTVALPREASSAIADFTTVVGGPGPQIAGLMMIGSGLDTQLELALISAGSDDDGWTVTRGVLDTVPRAWPTGTPVWFITPDTRAIDPTLYGAGSTVKYKLLTRTSLGVLPLADAPVVTRVLNARPHLPNRPANVKIEGNLWGPVTILTGVADVTVTWANRNRLMEETQIRTWIEGNVVPEDGQTTVIRVLDQSGNLITEHAGLSGTSFDIPVGSFGDVASANVRVISRRDDLESLQGMEITVVLEDRSGYGFDYGNHYDGVI